jgi:hypothetical protein
LLHLCLEVEDSERLISIVTGYVGKDTGVHHGADCVYIHVIGDGTCKIVDKVAGQLSGVSHRLESNQTGVFAYFFAQCFYPHISLGCDPVSGGRLGGWGHSIFACIRPIVTENDYATRAMLPGSLPVFTETGGRSPAKVQDQNECGRHANVQSCGKSHVEGQLRRVTNVQP